MKNDEDRNAFDKNDYAIAIILMTFLFYIVICGIPVWIGWSDSAINFLRNLEWFRLIEELILIAALLFISYLISIILCMIFHALFTYFISATRNK